MSALFHAPRVLTVKSPAIPIVAGQPALVPLKLEGAEGINSLFEYRLTLQTPDALNFMAASGSNFDLTAFVGLELSCFVELEGQGQFVPGLPGGAGAANQGAGVREISGMITEARFVGVDSRHALYELTLRPWLHLATLTTNCKVFQDQTPIEVIAAVLANYPFATTKRLIETYPQRDYTVQYNESDFEFITRLMQEWGINYHFEHSAGVHRLVWSDHNGAFQVTQNKKKGVSAYHSIPFYPLGHKIDREYIHGFSPVDSLTSGSYASREYDYTRPRATLAAEASAPRNTGHADEEVYLWRGDKTCVGGSDYSQPNRGADKAANQTEGQGKHLARLRMQALRQPGLRAKGVGHVRGIVPGCTFSLSGHPQEKANSEYMVLDTRLVIENVSEDTQRLALDTVSSGYTGGAAPRGGGLMVPNAHKSPPTPGYDAALGFGVEFGAGLGTALSDVQRLSGQWRVLVEFEVQPTTEVLRPVLNQRKPKTGGPETALVVGPSADTAESNIYTDALGRIKLQFPWDRYGQKNQNSSCWVRVSSAWAGNQLGAMHVPRIGEEVLVDFLGGDPELPFVKGRLFNAVNMPPWSLPEQQALSGFRSRELTPGGGNSAAGRSNHVVLDDTDQKIQAQLKSDHQHSSLSLGHITRIEDNAGRKDYRGEGFELRTDGHGVLRAKDGLLITTEGRTAAQAHAKDMGETTARLQQAQDQHASLGDLAAQHLAQDTADQGDVAQDLQAQNDAIQGKGGAGKFPELSEPHLVFSSPAGIASTTPGSTHQHSGCHHAITSGAHTSISAQRSLLASAKEAVRLFAYKSGIKLVSAAADIEVQALEKSMHFLSKVSITETAQTITFTAKEELTINGGGSFSTFKSGSIVHGTAGVWDVNAATKAMDGPKSLPVVMPPFPSALPFDEQFQVLKPTTGKPAQAIPFTIKTSSGETIQGVTDQEGRTPRIFGSQAESLELVLGGLQEGGPLEATAPSDSDGC
ncbi:type VI secretion system tip protein VgrG [Rhodoferax lacus]|uniref:Type VI secretion system tip protein VgrG n=1 Tax=Rhodoferax lacus TaxID=2184758 RepID=A0A3E1RBQ3_9BURK|nr:type VI secretion system Vgr family protein [Rhodoferax lacus]RFO96693.1 type VI secretion system tip protein VgrG [Rhodoferax lacus]